MNRLKLYLFNRIKIYLFTLVFIFTFLFKSSGNETIDSLEYMLNLSTPSQKIEILNQLAELYLYKSTATSIKYARMSIEISEELGDDKDKAVSYNLIAKAYQQDKEFFSALENYRIVLDIRRKLGDRRELAKAYNNIGITYYGLKQYDEALEHYKMALSIRQSLDEKDDLAKTYNNMCVLYTKTGDLDEALFYIQKLVDLKEQSDDRAEIARTYNFAGQINYTLGKFSNALDYYLKEIRIKEEIGDTKDFDIFLSNIAKIYHQMLNYEKAEEYYKKALNNIQKANERTRFAKVYNGLGNVYYDWQKYDLALPFYEKSLSLAKETKDQRGQSKILNNIGLIYKIQGNYQKALLYCTESLELKESLSDDDNIFYSFTSLAEINLQLGNYNKSLEYLKKSMEKARLLYQDRLVLHCYNLFYQVYSQMGDYKDAFDYHLLYTNLKDSLATETTSKMISELQVKYETSQKEQENTSLRQQNDIQRNYFLVVTGLILILCVVLINRYLSKRKANNLLGDMNLKIRSQHKNLESLYSQLQINENDLREANATKDKFFSIIAHDLKNPLSAIVLSSDLLINKFKFMSGDQLLELIVNINKAGNQLSNLLDNLLQWARTQTGKIQFQPEVLSLSSIVKDTISLIEVSSKRKNISIISNINEDSVVFADSNMVKTVVRNLLTNAIKFTPQNGTIQIETFIVSGYVECLVSDTGIGISEEDAMKLFRVDIQNIHKGTENEMGTGLGLILCKEFIEKHGGRIWVESSLGVGSTFRFTLPIEV